MMRYLQLCLDATIFALAIVSALCLGSEVRASIRCKIDPDCVLAHLSLLLCRIVLHRGGR